MKLLTTFLSVLACLSFVMPIATSSHPANRAPLSKAYIMKQHMDYSKGSLRIYGPDGTVLYRFTRHIQDPITGYTTVVLMSPASDALIVLESSNNLCGHKTTYTEMKVPGSRKRQFTIDPEGLLKDQWTFNYVDGTNKQQNFKFDRNYANKEGKVYQQIKGENGELVAEFEDQKRTDSWLTTSSTREVDTYTLFCTADSPQVELVLLMGLVMNRVHDCGL
ncbi:hypothetical protein PGTUg99_029057 [Puccinia graminis f. sp. tritici]|uniref:Uncharacterized protein n=1 Tax=Puccinia graminis f. sp. tritici TaxID=56615 RepID=A0A5B0PJY2_PUCGR|nr:hypothetical protein PGTUg99_029057 [Puccinia graminis f. sp. tritici]